MFGVPSNSLGEVLYIAIFTTDRPHDYIECPRHAGDKCWYVYEWFSDGVLHRLLQFKKKFYRFYSNISRMRTFDEFTAARYLYFL